MTFHTMYTYMTTMVIFTTYRHIIGKCRNYDNPSNINNNKYKILGIYSPELFGSKTLHFRYLVRDMKIAARVDFEPKSFQKMNLSII